MIRANMKAITIWPEWVFAMMHLGKRVENRSWPTRKHLGDTICIHAGKSIGGVEGHRAARRGIRALLRVAEDAGHTRAQLDQDWDLGAWIRPGLLDYRNHPDMPRSAIVGIARIANVRAAVPGAPWETGPYCWELEEVHRFAEPIPAPGKQGIWTLSDDQHNAVGFAGDQLIRAS